MAKEARIYYVSPLLIIISNPSNGNLPTLVLRQIGNPTEEMWEEIRRVLRLCKMGLVGTSYIRQDGLFCHLVREEV